MGAEISRSNVLTRLSMGMATGPIDEAENKTVKEIKPGIRAETGMFLPTAKERNINKGNITPNIKVPGRR